VGAPAQLAVHRDVLPQHHKYPPSLDYLLMTLGRFFCCWRRRKKLRGPLASALAVFGRVPFFF